MVPSQVSDARPGAPRVGAGPKRDRFSAGGGSASRASGSGSAAISSERARASSKMATARPDVRASARSCATSAGVGLSV